MERHCSVVAMQESSGCRFALLRLSNGSSPLTRADRLSVSQAKEKRRGRGSARVLTPRDPPDGRSFRSRLSERTNLAS